MKLYLVTRMDDPERDETSPAVVRAENSETALWLACGGPDPEYPDVRAFDRRPLHGFLADRSNAEVEELTADGPQAVILTD